MKAILLPSFFRSVQFSGKVIFCWFIGFLGLPGAEISAQSCYEKYRSEGIALVKKERYLDAISQFRAARRCADIPVSNDLDSRMDDAYEADRNRLEKLLTRAEKAEKTATEQAKLADEARKKAISEKEKADRIALSRLSEKVSNQAAIYAGHDSRILGMSMAEFGWYMLDSQHVDFHQVVHDAFYMYDQAGNSLAQCQLPLSMAMNFIRFLKPLESVAFSPDGELLAMGTQGGQIFIGNPATGQIVQTLKGHEAYLTECRFSPDGKYIVSCGYDFTCRVTEWKTGQEVWKIRNDQGLVSVDFSPDGKKVAFAGYAGVAEVWDWASNQKLVQLNLDKKLRSLAIRFSPDGTRLATVGSDGRLVVFNATDGTQLLTFPAHKGGVNTVAWAPDGRSLASGGPDGFIRVWNPDDGKELRNWRAEKNVVSNIAISPDGMSIASGSISSDGRGRVWNFETGEPILVLTGPPGFVRRLTFSPDGSRLACASMDKSASIWYLKPGAEAPAVAAHKLLIRDARWSPDQQFFLTASSDSTARIFRSADLTLLHVLKGHVGRVTRALYLPDGKRVATAASDGKIKIWSSESGEELFTLEGHRKQISDLDVSKNGELLISSSLDSTVRIWNLDEKKEILKVVGHLGEVQCVNFSPDGESFISGSTDATTRSFSAKTGEMQREYALHSIFSGRPSTVMDALWSPDGKWVITVSTDGFIKIQNAVTGDLIQNPFNENVEIMSADFSPDSRRFATGGRDGVVRIWEIPDGRLLLTIRAHEKACRKVTFSSDGNSLLTASDEGVVKIWKIAMPALLEEWHRKYGYFALNPNLLELTRFKDALFYRDDYAERLKAFPNAAAWIYSNAQLIAQEALRSKKPDEMQAEMTRAFGLLNLAKTTNEPMDDALERISFYDDWAAQLFSAGELAASLGKSGQALKTYREASLDNRLMHMELNRRHISRLIQNGRLDEAGRLADEILFTLRDTTILPIFECKKAEVLFWSGKKDEAFQAFERLKNTRIPAFNYQPARDLILLDFQDFARAGMFDADFYRVYQALTGKILSESESEIYRRKSPK